MSGRKRQHQGTQTDEQDEKRQRSNLEAMTDGKERPWLDVEPGRFEERYLRDHFPWAHMAWKKGEYPVAYLLTMPDDPLNAGPAMTRMYARLFKAVRERESSGDRVYADQADTDYRLPFWLHPHYLSALYPLSNAPLSVPFELPEWSKYREEREKAGLSATVEAIVTFSMPDASLDQAWKRTHAFLLFKSRLDGAHWLDSLSENKPQSEGGFRVYRMRKYGGWEEEDHVPRRTRETLFGYDETLDAHHRYFQVLTSKEAFLTAQGASSVFNIRWTGEPGMGKTSAAVVLATELDVPLYIADMGSVDPGDLHKVLSPARRCVVLVDDFHLSASRYLGSREALADLLNAMDGAVKGQCVLRLFAMNHGDFIESSVPLRQRFPIHHRFTVCQAEHFAQRIRSLLPPGCDEELLERMAEYCVERQISMRVITSHVVRHLCDDAPDLLQVIWDTREAMTEVVLDSDVMKKDQTMAIAPLRPIAPEPEAASPLPIPAEIKELEDQKLRLIGVVAGLAQQH